MQSPTIKIIKPFGLHGPGSVSGDEEEWLSDSSIETDSDSDYVPDDETSSSGEWLSDSSLDTDSDYVPDEETSSSDEFTDISSSDEEETSSRRLLTENSTPGDLKLDAIERFEMIASAHPEDNLVIVLGHYKTTYEDKGDYASGWVIRCLDLLLFENGPCYPIPTAVSQLRIKSIGYSDIDSEISPITGEDIGSLFLSILTGTANGNQALPVSAGDQTDEVSNFRTIIDGLTTQQAGKNTTMKFFKEQTKERQRHYLDLLSDIKNDRDRAVEKPFLLALMDMGLDDSTRSSIVEYILTFESLQPSSGEFNKMRNLIQAIKSIPFGKMCPTPPALLEAMQDDGTKPSKRARTEKPAPTKLGAYLASVRDHIDTGIYGHEETKNQTMRLIASMITNGTATGGHCFAMCGPPGVGKTEIASKIATALGRPFIKMNMGGASNGEDLVGHGYTYEGSTYGMIARSLMDAKCENPVMFFDELDKVSQTTRGQEINNVLIHMTDSTQNHQFNDKYLAGINIDLSKVIMIFSFNDSATISPILLDRMKIIRVGGYKVEDKVKIAQKYLIPRIKKDLGYTQCKYSFEDCVIRDIVTKWTFEGGVRKLKELITDVFMELNLRKMTGQPVLGMSTSAFTVVSKKMLKDDIFKDRHYINHQMVSNINTVGSVNGLWANAYGVGGLIPIEAHLIPSSAPFELQLTGMQGDVMKESMKVAKTVAWRMTPETKKIMIRKQWKRDGNSCIHIHCPDGSTPKDGPSAGGAITTCIISLLTGKKVDQSYAMTGEIDLSGKISAIGGLEEKTFGAKTSGVKTILYPADNERDADKIREKFPELFDKTIPGFIEMFPVSCIEDIISRVII